MELLKKQVSAWDNRFDNKNKSPSKLPSKGFISPPIKAKKTDLSRNNKTEVK
jgi:hypothetical protein